MRTVTAGGDGARRRRHALASTARVGISAVAPPLGLAAGLLVLHALGGGSPIAATDGGLTAADPTLLIVHGARWIGLAVGWYLAAALLLSTVFRALGWWRAAHLVSRILPRAVRRLLPLAVAATVATSTSAAATPSRPRPIVSDATSTSTTSNSPAPPEDVITMRRLPDPGIAAAGSTGDAPAPPATARTWTIEPGQHLWSIASEVLHRHLGRRPTDTEIDPYWRTLVDANRSRLADPGQPDLVYPGQVLDVPDVAPPNV